MFYSIFFSNTAFTKYSHQKPVVCIVVTLPMSKMSLLCDRK
uniref:Uncharacterized protein n=1 Tax=Setaria italica TaxID=4555 RepID=K3Z1F3_SETIT